MTGYTVHTGATAKFVAGWDQIFKKQGQAQGTAAKKKKKPAAKKKVPAKSVKSKARNAAKKKK
jgi:hypothetical protein